MSVTIVNKGIAVLALVLITWAGPTFAANNCFIAQENDKVLQEEGDCQSRYAPQSTFKIALSLMGFDSGILQDEKHPSWPCGKGCDHYINVCKGEHNPGTWMRDSCLWYSRLLTGKLGMERFRSYITQFRYGNMDLTGDKGQNNGLSHAWISSSLQISPKEQIEFLKDIIGHKLAIAQEAYDKTKNIMFIQEMSGGWKLYGKTGNGSQLNQLGNKTDLQHGWFVGYIEKGRRRIIFASHIAYNEKQSTFASFRARNEALIKLWYLIDRLER